MVGRRPRRLGPVRAGRYPGRGPGPRPAARAPGPTPRRGGPPSIAACRPLPPARRDGAVDVSVAAMLQPLHAFCNVGCVLRNVAVDAIEGTYMSGSSTDIRSRVRPSEDRLHRPQKPLPAAADGQTVAEFLAERPRLSEFSTPLLVLDDGALADNTARMAGWCAEHGVELAPHGKTTMAPDLWR